MLNNMLIEVLATFCVGQAITVYSYKRNEIACHILGESQ